MSVDSGRGYLSTWYVGPTPTSANFPRSELSFWISCGVKGYTRDFLKFKYLTDTPTGFVGLESPNCAQDCLELSLEGNSSFIRNEDVLMYFISTSDSDGATKLVDLRLVDGYLGSGGKNSVCVGNKTAIQSTQCFRMVLGAGTVRAEPLWNFCGIIIPTSAVVDFCVRDFTECEVTQLSTPKCMSTESNKGVSGMYVYMISLSSSGWTGAQYQISTPKNTASDVIGKNYPPAFFSRI